VLKYFLEPAYPSFKIKNLRGYFTTIYIIKGFISAFALSLFIYLNYFGVEKGLFLKLITSISALGSFYLILSQRREVLFWVGVFVGLLWFYWIGFSFRYYDMSYVIPLMLIFVSLGYGLIFCIIGLFTPIIRAILFTYLSLIHPLNFNWFIPEISLLDSFFGVEKWQFFIILFSISLFITIKHRWRYLALFGILLATNVDPNHKLQLPKQSIYLSSLSTPQDLKWEESYKDKSIDINLAIINDAIDKKYDIVVLSESAFALFLNQEPYIMQLLKDLSKQIAIVTGALYFDGKDSYNSTYYIINGEVKIANKVVLVPFGEEIPLPKFISKFINKIVYDGAEDYIAAKNPTEVDINGEVFRNAICYEATRDELFVGDPKFMIAISNNAWFTPSIEPTLQKLLLRYFSRIHNTVIYHSATMGENALIRGD
jgi:apolipoprotein N-acyltransferase